MDKNRPDVGRDGSLFAFLHAAKFSEEWAEDTGRADEQYLHTLVLPRGRKRSFLTVGHFRSRAATAAARIPIASRTVRATGGKNRVSRIPRANASVATVAAWTDLLQHFIAHLLPVYRICGTGRGSEKRRFPFSFARVRVRLRPKNFPQPLDKSFPACYTTFGDIKTISN